MFDPPLWRQRRTKVSDALKKYRASSVLDLGCGDGALLQILLNDTSFNRLAGVDKCEEDLKLAVQNCQPTNLDFQFLRELPVTLNLYLGNTLYISKFKTLMLL